MRKVAFIPFGEFKPDEREFTNPYLQECKNFLPLFTSYRPWRKLGVISSVADTNAPTGAIAHPVLSEEQIQIIRPDSDIANTGWVSLPTEGEGLFSQINEGTVSDASKIVAGGAPTSRLVRLGLQNPLVPGSTSGHIVRYRYKIVNHSGAAWTLNVRLEKLDQTIIHSENETGSADTAGVIQDSFTLSAAEAGTISDYTEIGLRFVATVPGVAQVCTPDADNQVGSWVNQAGSGTNLFQSIDEATASDSDYISTGFLTAGEVKTYRCALTDVLDPYVATGHVVRYRYKALNAGMRLIVRLKQNTTVIATATHSSISPGSWIDGVLTLSAAEADAITDYTALFLEFEGAYPTEITSTVAAYERPDGDITNELDTWQKEPGDGITDLWQAIDEVALDTTDFIKFVGFATGAPAAEYEYECSLSNLSDPKTNAGHKFRLDYFKSFSQPANSHARIFLLQGSTTIHSFDLQYTFTASGVNAWAEHVETLSQAVVAQITNYSDLRFRIETNIGYTGGLTSLYNTARVRLEVPEGRELQVSWTKVDVPSAARAEVTWAEMQIPSPDVTFYGDKIEIYVGNEPKIYRVTDSGFTDVSKAGGYATGGDVPHSWDFASWGGDLLATNYVDPVQTKATGSALFADLITSTAKPQARFIATVRDFVMLGDINYGGTPAGFSDEVWWSAIDNALNFDVATLTQCDRQRLRQTSGQIMGLVGGEYAVVFKRNSIIRMDYVGAPIIFWPSVVSIKDGTDFPRSIVPVGNDIYFWSVDGLKVLRNGNEVERLGDESIRKMIIDSEFSNHSYLGAASGTVAPREEDAILFGAHDPYSNLLFWFYRAKSDAAALLPADALYQNNKGIVYDPLTKRFTRFEDTNRDSDISVITSRFNALTDDTAITRGLLGFQWTGANINYFKFGSASTYASQIKTGTYTLDPAKKVLLHRLRPFFKPEPTSATVPLSLSLRVSNDPLMVEDVDTRAASFIDDHGWYVLESPSTGTFFEVTLNVSSMASINLKEIDGFQIEYSVESDY